MSYKVIDLVQGTQDWLRWRHDGIGASEAGAVLDAARRQRLLAEKLELEPDDSDAGPDAQRGKMLEAPAREAYIAEVRVHVRPVCLQSVERPWLHASLDGLSSDGRTAVEIKCGERNYQRVAANGEVPDYHYAQLQHIMAITGLEAMDYWAFDPDEGGILLVEQRDDVLIERLLTAEEVFWERVCRLRATRIAEG